MVNSKGGEKFFAVILYKMLLFQVSLKFINEYSWWGFFFYTNLSKYSPIQFDYIIQLKYTIEEVSQIPIPKKQAYSLDIASGNRLALGVLESNSLNSII